MNVLPYECNLWWGSRRESLEEVAARLFRLVDGLRRLDPAFSQFLLRSSGRPALPNLLCPTPLTAEGSVELLRRSRTYYDVPPDRVWPELGFSLSSTSVERGDLLTMWDLRAGVFESDRHHANSFDLGLPAKLVANGATGNCDQLRRLLALLIVVLDAREASIDEQKYESKHFRPMTADGKALLFPWVGWLTYLPPDLVGKVSVPKDIRVDRLDNGGIIATLCEEPFTIDNPEHMRRARAMEAAVRPIQS